MANYKIFLDMDGVLADFVGHICAAHKCPNVYENPETMGISLGLFDIDKIWGISAREFWAPANDQSFWESIPPTKECFRLVEMTYDIVGEDNVCILTAPALGNGCIPGKRAWIKKYFPELDKKIIFATAKGFIAGPNKILIDDRDKNIDGWVERGGEGILVPRLWNRFHEIGKQSDVFEYIKRDLNEIINNRKSYTQISKS